MVSCCVEALDDGKAVTGYFGGLVAHQRTTSREAARPFITELPHTHRQQLSHSTVLQDGKKRDVKLV